MKTLRIPALEEALARCKKKARHPNVVEFTVVQLYKVILGLMEENERLKKGVKT